MRTRILPVATLAVALLAGCTGGDPAPDPTGGTPDPDQTSEVNSWTAAELARVTLEGDDAQADPLGEVEGALRQVVGDDVPARIRVTEVLADEGGTIVRFAVGSTDGSETTVAPYAFNWAHPLLWDIRDIALVDPSAQMRLQPFLGTRDQELPQPLCTCSRHPSRISDGAGELTATFPPLDASTKDVTLEFPGFPALEGVAVTRP